MKKLRNKALAGIVGITMVITAGLGTSTYATGSFTDVPADHWALSNINFAAEKNIINGYLSYDGTYTFAPEQAVTYEEATAMLYRAMNAAGKLSDNGSESLVADYESLLIEQDIAQWAREYVAYFLHEGIIDESELPAFVGAEHLGNKAPRAQIAVWTAKALDKPLAAAYYLPFTDSGSISAADRPYLDLLYRQGIMKGSLQENQTIAFLPNDGIKRSEFAAISNRVYENAADTEYSLDKNAYLYTSTENLYFADKVKVIQDGEETSSSATQAVAAATAKSQNLVISGLASEEAAELLHINTGAVRGSGTVKDVVSLSKNAEQIAVETDGTIIYYILDENTDTEASIKTGDKINYIADGIYLAEVE